MKRDDLFAGYEQGQRDMLAKCIDAVEAVPAIAQHVDDNGMISLVYDKSEIIAALRALREKQ